MTHVSRILLLTASYGDGHLLASFAVKEHFHKFGNVHVQVIDLMKEAHPLLHKCSTAAYMGSFRAARYGFNYYGWSYYLTQKSTRYSPLLVGLNRLGYQHLLKIVMNEQPDVIINTFPYGAAPAIGRAFKIPTFTILTDYFMHARWLHPHIDKYYVATDDLKQDMMRSGVQEDQIEVSGIPIRESFETIPFPTKSHQKKIILLFAGTHSEQQETSKLIQKLQSINDCHLKVVCGRNKKLEQFLRSQYPDRQHLSILGFVSNIHELMAQAACMISKAGGLTLAESLALQTPIFIYRPFSGQEKDNATYFSKKGVAVISNDINELVKQVADFMSNEMYASQMRSKMASMHRARAADTIVNDVLKHLHLYKKRAAPYS